MAEIKWPEMCLACDEPISDHTVKDLKACRDGLLDDAGKMLKAFKQLDKIYIKKRQQTLSKEVNKKTLNRKRNKKESKVEEAKSKKRC